MNCRQQAQFPCSIQPINRDKKILNIVVLFVFFVISLSITIEIVTAQRATASSQSITVAQEEQSTQAQETIFRQEKRAFTLMAQEKQGSSDYECPAVYGLFAEEQCGPGYYSCDDYRPTCMTCSEGLVFAQITEDIGYCDYPFVQAQCSDKQ